MSLPKKAMTCMYKRLSIECSMNIAVVAVIHSLSCIADVATKQKPHMKAVTAFLSQTNVCICC